MCQLTVAGSCGSIEVVGWSYLGDDEISVVERSKVKVDEHIMVTELGDLFILKLEVLEATGACDSPLFGGIWCHG